MSNFIKLICCSVHKCVGEANKLISVSEGLSVPKMDSKSKGDGTSENRVSGKFVYLVV